MTIYRLNRVPDKLHVALLELLGIRLDGPSAATTEPALPARRRRRPSRSLIPGGATEVGTLRTASDESIIFQVDEDFTIPPARPAAYVLQRGGQVKDVGVADGEARPQGADQLAVRHARRRSATRSTSASRSRSDRLLMQVDVDASQARGAGVEPRGPAAALGGLPGRRPVGRRRACSRTSPAASTTAPARSSSSCRRARASQPLGGPPRCTGCAAGSTTRPAHGGSGATYTHPPEIYSITAAPIGALLPADARRARSSARSSASQRRHARPDLPAAPPAGAQARHGRDARGPGPRVRRLGALGAARPTSSARPSSTATSCSTSSRGEVELGPAIRETDGGWTQYGAVPPKGAVLRFTALPPRRRARRQRRGRAR